MYRFYKQVSAGKDVVFLLLADDSPDEVVAHDDVALLYNNKRLIGANFFGKEASLLSSYGMHPTISDLALSGFNAALEKHGATPLSPLASSGFIVGEVTEVEEHPLDEKKSILKISCLEKVHETVARAGNKVGDKVVVAMDSSFLADGSLFLSHVDHNLKVDVLLVGSEDLGLSEEDFENLLSEKQSGDDLFV